MKEKLKIRMKLIYKDIYVGRKKIKTKNKTNLQRYLRSVVGVDELCTIFLYYAMIEMFIIFVT